jgi:hypothetical protein
MKDLVPELKDRAIFLGWIAGLALAGILLWSLTQTVRTQFLLRTVNRALVMLGDERRLSGPLARPSARPVPMGSWYSLLASDSVMFVFTVMRDGIQVPCGALVSKEGRVTDILPLSSHARQVLGRIPPGVMRIYIRRIEAAAAKGGGR